MLKRGVNFMTLGASGPATPREDRNFRAAVVEDDKSVLDAVSAMLEIEGFDVDRYRDGQSAFEGFRQAPPDIALVDLVMPHMDGMELVRRVREHWNFPLIIVTGQDDEIDEAMGLRLGADDYVHKPFAKRLLLERIRANLRRVQHPIAPAQSPPRETTGMVRGPLVMDPECHSVVWRGSAVSLTVTEFQLLEALARRPGVVKTRDQLMDIAYSDNVYVDDRTIDSHIKRLRKKLRAVDAGFSAIETLYGVGYRFSMQQPTECSA